MSQLYREWKIIISLETAQIIKKPEAILKASLSFLKVHYDSNNPQDTLSCPQVLDLTFLFSFSMHISLSLVFLMQNFCFEKAQTGTKQVDTP